LSLYAVPRDFSASNGRSLSSPARPLDYLRRLRRVERRFHVCAFQYRKPLCVHAIYSIQAADAAASRGRTFGGESLQRRSLSTRGPAFRGENADVRLCTEGRGRPPFERKVVAPLLA